MWVARTSDPSGDACARIAARSSDAGCTRQWISPSRARTATRSWRARLFRTWFGIIAHPSGKGTPGESVGASDRRGCRRSGGLLGDPAAEGVARGAPRELLGLLLGLE